MVTVVERKSLADGVNVTLKLHFAPAATLPLQVEWLIANSAALLLVTPEIATGIAPVLASVKACGALLVPTFCLANRKRLGTLSIPVAPGAVPMPVMERVCGLPVPVLVTVIDADRAPAADAVNVTLKLQLAPAATTPEQLELLIANSGALLLVIAPIVTPVPPVLVSVKACGAPATPTVCVPKAKDAGTLSTPGVATLFPVPDTAIACGLPVPVLVTVTDAERAPAADGVKVTLKLQLAPAATLPAQVEPEIANSAALLLATEETLTAVPPVLLSENTCGGPAAPTVWAAKANGAGMLRTPGVATAVPVPVRATVLAPALLFTVSVALRLPAADGENDALIVQDAPLASEAGQVLVVGNSAALLLAMLKPEAAAVPVLETVIVVAALVEPTFCAAKVNDAGATPMTGAPAAGQVGAAAIQVAMSSRSLAVYLPWKTAISGTPLLIALAILVGLLAPFWILFAPLEGSALWHEFDAQLRPLTGAA